MYNIPKKVIYSVVYLIGFFLYIKSGLPGPRGGLASWPGLLIAASLCYAVFTPLYWIECQWPMFGFIMCNIVNGLCGRAPYYYYRPRYRRRRD
jgi:hypothetical protein